MWQQVECVSRSCTWTVCTGENVWQGGELWLTSTRRKSGSFMRKLKMLLSSHMAVLKFRQYVVMAWDNLSNAHLMCSPACWAPADTPPRHHRTHHQMCSVWSCDSPVWNQWGWLEMTCGPAGLLLLQMVLMSLSNHVADTLEKTGNIYLYLKIKGTQSWLNLTPWSFETTE